MRKIKAFIAGLLLTSVLMPMPAYAQSTVTVVGPAPVPGNCVQWFSTTQIKDPGITCNGGAGTSPGGSSGQVQFNNSGTFGGLTNTQLTALINPATALLPGALPAWPNNTTTFFRGDGTYATLNFAALGGVATAAQLPATGGLGFQFNKGGTNQTGLTNNAYNRLTWSTTLFNTTGAALSSNTWTAPITGIMIMSFSIFCDSCLNTPNSGSPTFDGKFIRNSAGTCNGNDINAVLGGPSLGGASNTAFSSGAAVISVTAGDLIELCTFPTSVDAANDVIIDGNKAHTWWSGAYIR